MHEIAKVEAISAKDVKKYYSKITNVSIVSTAILRELLLESYCYTKPKSWQKLIQQQ